MGIISHCVFHLILIQCHLEPIPAPANLMVSQRTARSIELHFQKAEKSIVDKFLVQYNYTVNACGERRTITINMTVQDNDMYLISDSDETPVEEDSQYDISVTAFNSVGSSEAVTIHNVSTLKSGINFITLLLLL